MARPTKSKAGPVKRISVSLSPEAYAILQAASKRLDRTQTWLLEQLIKGALNKQNRRNT